MAQAHLRNWLQDTGRADESQTLVPLGATLAGYQRIGWRFCSDTTEFVVDISGEMEEFPTSQSKALYAVSPLETSPLEELHGT